MKRLSRFLGIALVLFLFRGTTAVEWTRISSYPTDADLNSITHGEGIVVAAGGNKIIYSLDSGQTWREVLWPSSVSIRSVTYGNDIFVAVTTDGRSLVSDNGIDWSSHPVLSASLNGLVFGNGLFVAGANSGTIATSTDGISWNLITGISTNNIYLAEFGNNTFLLKDQETPRPASVIISTNGVSWSRLPVSGIQAAICERFGCSQSSQFAGVTFGAGGFVARVDYFGSPYGSGSKFYVSSDGLNWSEQGSTPDGPAFNFVGNTLFYKNGIYFVTSLGVNAFVADSRTYYTPAVYSSTNHLFSWTAKPFPGVTRIEIITTAVDFDGNNYIVVGAAGLVAYGTSMDSLKRVDNSEKYAGLVSVASHGNTLVGVPELIVSTNGGRSFQQAQFPATGWDLSSVRYRNGMFMAVGAPGSTFRSIDGISWTAAPAVVPGRLMDVEFAEGKWISVGLNGAVVMSSDGNGTKFAQKNSGTDIDLNGVAWGNGRFVAVGDSGAFLTSTDAENWSLSGTSEGTDLWGVAYGNSRFVAVGDGGRVYISADGVEWSSRRIVGAAALPRIAFAHGLFLTVGINTEKSYTSPDGTNWTQVNIPGQALFGADASEGRLFASGSPKYVYGNTAYGSAIFAETINVLSVNAIIGSDGLVQLSWPNPDNGNDSVFATGDLNGNAWELVGTTQTGQWKDTNAISGTRLYRVRND
jgi:hypothetical protein